MKIKFEILTTLLILELAGPLMSDARGATRLTLVKDGAPQCTIVVAKTPSRMAVLAASDLQQKGVNPSYCALLFLRPSAKRAKMIVCRENRESSIPVPSTM